MPLTKAFKTEESDAEKRRLQSLTKNGKDIIALIDAQGNVTYRSSSYNTIFGYQPENISPQVPFENIHADDIPVMRSFFETLARTSGSTDTMQWRQINKNGDYLWMQGTATNLLGDPDIKGIVCNFRDITEHVKIKEDLENMNRELNLLINNIDEVAYTAMINPYRITYMSASCFKMYGYHAQDFLHNEQLWAELIIPEDRYVINEVTKALQAGQTASCQFRILYKDGTLKWIESNVSPTLDKHGKLLRFDGLNRDITEKKNTELALLISEKKFRTLIENSKDGIALSNSDRKFLYISPAIKDITGYEAEALIGKNTFDLFHPEEQVENATFLSKLINKTDPLAPKVLRVFHKDGSWRWVEITASNKLDDPAINAIVTNFRDITDKKKSEQALLNSEKKFRSLIENSKECIGLTDSTGRIMYVTSAITAIMGYTPEELIGKEYFSMIHPEEVDRNLGHVETMINTNQTHITEVVRTQHKDGSWRWIEATITNRLTDPAVGAIVSNIRDVTDRKNVEEALIQSEKRYRALIENNKEGIALINRDRQFTYLSPSSKGILGYDPEELIGTKTIDLYHPEDQAMMGDLVRSLTNGEISNVCKLLQVRNKDGAWRWMELTITNQYDNPAINALVANFRDMDEKKNAEKAAINSEKRFRALIENNKDGIALTDENRIFIYLSPSVKDILGYAQHELIGQKAGRLYHPDDRPKMNEMVQSVLSNKNIVGSALVRMLHKDEQWRWIEVSASNQFDDAAVNAMVANFRDVTERKKAEEALTYSEQRFKSLTEKNQDVITLTAADGSWVYMSPSLKDLLDYGPEELVGTPAMDLMHPDELPANIAHLTWVNENPGKSMFMTLRLRHKDGSWRWVEATSTSQLHNPAVNAIVSNLRDITARKKAQDELEELNQSLEKKVAERTMQLEESNKSLESFSSIAAHDLQAPLRVISGYTSIIKQDYGEVLGESGFKLLDTVIKQTKHMSQLVSDLLTFSRASHTVLKQEIIDLDKLAVEIYGNLQLANQGATIANIKIHELGSCSGDSGLLRQVLTNLISNAIKYSAKKENPTVEIGCTREGNETIYYVKDNGAGFEMKSANKLFQVFQRLHTMSDFEGTGIGLALVKNIITRHGGRIWAESDLDKGATFYFTLSD